MDDIINLAIKSDLAKRIIESIITKAIRKSTGLDIDVTFRSMSVKVENGKFVADINARVESDYNSTMKYISERV